MMRIETFRKLHKASEWLLKRFTSKGLILMYHSVAEMDFNPWSLNVNPKNFAEHLEVLQKYAYPMSLMQLLKAHQKKQIPERAVVITFDDGYANNLHYAKPILENYGVPATIFVSTGYIGKAREFWWDELEQIFLQPGKLPEKLSLNINGKIHHWDLGIAVDYSTEDKQQDHSVGAWEAQSGSRLFFYNLMGQLLQSLPPELQLTVLNDILIWADAKPIVRQTHRPLTSEELVSLGQGNLVEIGAHTVNHSFLPAHSVSLQQDEIQRSKSELEQILKQPVLTFSYPFGSYTAETVKLTQSAGFVCACSTIPDTVWRQSNCFQLPRFWVKNWNREEFSQQLLQWFDN